MTEDDKQRIWQSMAEKNTQRIWQAIRQKCKAEANITGG